MSTRHHWFPQSRIVTSPPFYFYNVGYNSPNPLLDHHRPTDGRLFLCADQTLNNKHKRIWRKALKCKQCQLIAFDGILLTALHLAHALKEGKGKTGNKLPAIRFQATRPVNTCRRRCCYSAWQLHNLFVQCATTLLIGMIRISHPQKSAGYSHTPETVLHCTRRYTGNVRFINVPSLRGKRRQTALKIPIKRTFAWRTMIKIR